MQFPQVSEDHGGRERARTRQNPAAWWRGAIYPQVSNRLWIILENSFRGASMTRKPSRRTRQSPRAGYLDVMKCGQDASLSGCYPQTGSSDLTATGYYGPMVARFLDPSGVDMWQDQGLGDVGSQGDVGLGAARPATPEGSARSRRSAVEALIVWSCRRKVGMMGTRRRANGGLPMMAGGRADDDAARARR